MSTTHHNHQTTAPYTIHTPETRTASGGASAHCAGVAGSGLDVADCCVTLEEARDVIRRREAYVREIIDWMDERRNATEATTLGQIQDKLRPLLSPNNGRETRRE